MSDPITAEAIRKRPGMWVGSTRDGSGIAHMVWEVVANAIDEHLAGACDQLSVEVGEDGAVTVEDNGRGFPLSTETGKPLAEWALTRFHHTPTLDGHAPHAHVGKHGIGVFPICALSASLELQVYRQGRCMLQRFAKGLVASGVEDRGPSDHSGTRLTFLPDPEIFTGRTLDSSLVLERLTELSFLLPRLTIRFTDRRQHVLNQPDGLAGHLEAMASDSRIGSVFRLKELAEDVEIDIAARWGSFPNTSVHSFANTERTTDGGTHVKGLLAGLSEGFKQAAPQLGRCTPTARARAMSRGLSALVCIRLNDPAYDQPTKSRLTTPRVQRIVKTVVTRNFAKFLAGEPQLLAHLSAATR
jgi:DNA gyrase subunit B